MTIATHQSIRAGQNTPTAATHNPAWATAYDCGNGSVKLIINSAEIRIPSYIQPILFPLRDVPATGFVEYLDGDRADLISRKWVGGISAYHLNPTTLTRVVDSRSSKIELGLQLLLSALTELPHRDQWYFALIASIHDAQAMGEKMGKALRGTHRVKLGSQLSTVTIDVIRVLEEGAAAIVEHRSELDLSGQNLIYDFGNGTLALSMFGAKGKLLDRQIFPGGVETLIDAIARNLETRKQLSGEGDRHLIHSEIERKDFLYSKRSGWNFRSVYEAEIKPWVASNLAPVIKAASKWEMADVHLAIGGGSQLPLISQLLAARGISAVSDGVWANARGMYKLAHAKVEATQP